jgi:hypothetical protein
VARWGKLAAACAAVAACSGGQTTVATVTLCPEGSALDPQSQTCTAVQPVRPVAVAPVERVEEPLPLPAPAEPAAAVTAEAAVAVAAPSSLPAPAKGYAVDVRCTFPDGWVSLLPAGKYPKNDQFLMQSLIGLTRDPGFWKGIAEYRPLHPFAAQPCVPGVWTRLPAPSGGDYFLLAGQAGTFRTRGTYEKNGVRRRMSVRASAEVTLSAADLVHTWVCISCPWVVFSDGNGGDLEPFVVLAHRRARGRRGTDVHLVERVPVSGGKIRLRVVEVEQEITHLDRLALRWGGHDLAPVGAGAALARDDGSEVTLPPRTEVGMTYAVPGVRDGFVDVEVVATGWYDPL